MLLNHLTALFIKYDIDYPSLLILYDIKNNTDYFKNYFKANEGKYARTNIERGTLTNFFILFNNKLIEKEPDFELKTIHTKPLDTYYKKFKLTPKSNDILNQFKDIEKNNIIKTKINDTDINNWIDEYRNIWLVNGKQLKTNALGAKQMCIDKMQRFMLSHPQYSKELIIEASKKYVENYISEHRGDCLYLITAPYFIERQRNVIGNNENSSMRLADYCELLLNENVSTNKTLASHDQSELA